MHNVEQDIAIKKYSETDKHLGDIIKSLGLQRGFMNDIARDTGKSNFLEMLPSSVLKILIDKNTNLL